MQRNTRVILRKRPDGTATADCFDIEEVELPPVAVGEVRVAVEFISVDAGTRTMLRGEGFHHQVGLGATVLAGGVGRVIESRCDGWEVGQAVRGGLGVQRFATMAASQLEKLDDTDLPLSSYLGVLGGSTGITAWIGVRCVARPAVGDVFVVSAAAGGVGSLAGQIAKRDGATVIGIAGGERKQKFLTEELGFDAAIDYKSEDIGQRLQELAPQGVNIFFDNVGGRVLDAVLDRIAMQARVVICGAVSQYDDMDNVVGPSMYLRLAERRSLMEGFAYFHYPEEIPRATGELKSWLAEGSIVMPEEILQGIERYPDALAIMFSGGNLGKLMVAV